METEKTSWWQENKEWASWFLVLGAGMLVILALIVVFGSWYVIGPTERGVKTTLGHMDETFIEPGLHMKLPVVTTITKVNIQQATQEMEATCSSSDMQDVRIKVRVMFRVPEGSVVQTLRDYHGDPFDSLIGPRVQEALKEVTALKSAVDIVTGREQVKAAALKAAKSKIGQLLEVNDLIVEDVNLSPELEKAIENKMVQQQEAEKSVFKKQQALTDAETLVIAAKGQAESIRIQGDAIAKNPSLIQLKMVEKWNGVTPQYVGGGQANILLPVPEKK